MKPSELYATEPVRVDSDLSALFGCYYNHIPEVDTDNYWQFATGDIRGDRIQIRYYKDHSYDGRRIWRLASVWLDNRPFMIIQNAGREGDDHAARFITDVDLYKVAAAYIKSLLPPCFGETLDTVDAETDIPNLTEFYSDSLYTMSERW